MCLADLPRDVAVQVLDLLPTRHRARMALVSKAWHDVVTDSWSKVMVENVIRPKLDPLLNWLSRLSCIGNDGGQHLLAITLHMQDQGPTHWPEDLSLSCFRHLRSIDLCHSGENKRQAGSLCVTPGILQQLSTLTKLKHLSANYKNVDGHSASGNSAAICLKEIGAFPSLCELDLQIRQNPGQHQPCLYTSNLSGLSMLTRLEITYGCMVIVDESFKHLMQQLRVMNCRLKTEEPDTIQVMVAPDLSRLTFWDFSLGDAERFTFKSLHSLQSLTVETKEKALKSLCWPITLTELRLRCCKGLLAESHLQTLTHLTNLRTMEICEYDNGRHSIMHGLTKFTRLETLTIDNSQVCELHDRPYDLLLQDDEHLPHLTSLTLVECHFREAPNSDCCLKRLPRLINLHIKYGEHMGSLDSDSVRFFTVESQDSMQKLGNSYLGRMPNLESLHRELDYVEVARLEGLVPVFKALLHLRSLTIINTQTMVMDDDANFRFFPYILTAIKDLPRLEKLELSSEVEDVDLIGEGCIADDLANSVASVNDFLLPSVQHLGLGCRSLRSDPGSPWYSEAWSKLKSLCLFIGPFDSESAARSLDVQLGTALELHAKVIADDTSTFYLEAYKCGISENANWLTECSIMSQTFRDSFS